MWTRMLIKDRISGDTNRRVARPCGEATLEISERRFANPIQVVAEGGAGSEPDPPVDFSQKGRSRLKVSDV